MNKKEIDIACIGFTVGLITALIFNSIHEVKRYKLPASKQNTPIVKPSLSPTPTPTPITHKISWRGWVSFYSTTGCLGCNDALTMANGQTLKDDAYTIAFNWLPLNTKVKLTNLSNGKTTFATVTDTGGFWKCCSRIADLTPAVKNALEAKTDNSIILIEQL